ncbi:MAG: hypothetical protein JO205_14800 [Pseudolabrys sp.]|nr:hypothetical protein [Pseudolabrys sp.]MBV9262634.1 hypothetical protein [Pseudolabrys sp.]
MAQGARPFDRLAGEWTGNGKVEFSNGNHEPLKCRAAYDVIGNNNNVQLNIRCAGESYVFDLRGSATYASGSITGTWSESTRNAAGTITGQVQGERFQILAKSESFSATMTLVTRGDRQSVQIKSGDAQSSIKGATIELKRS